MAFFESIAKLGKKTPLQDLRELPEYLYPIWEAFTVLNAQRQRGWQACPISIGDMLAYFELLDFPACDVRLEWFELLQQMDMAWLQYLREETDGHREAKS